MKEIYCIISGYVQIVMFRAFAQRKAHSLGLVGTVRNLNNGTVEVVAKGSKEKLEVFIRHLRKGPLLARVDDIQVTWREPSVPSKDFQIIF